MLCTPYASTPFTMSAGADMCANMLLHRPWPSQLRHLALHDLPLRPDDPRLMAAVQAQSQLVVRRLQLLS